MLTPTRRSRSPPARSVTSRLSAPMRACIANAARTARSSSSSCATGTPNTAITASPMNFSTVPPNRSISSTIASKNGRSTPRRSSGSSRVASSVDPLMSAKITVTTLRSSGVTPAAGAGSPPLGDASGVPQFPQKRNEGAQVWPHEGHVRSRDDPQAPQNRRSGDAGAPQLGQVSSSIGRHRAIRSHLFATVDPGGGAVAGLIPVGASPHPGRHRCVTRPCRTPTARCLDRGTRRSPCREPDRARSRPYPRRRPGASARAARGLRAHRRRRRDGRRRSAAR